MYEKKLKTFAMMNPTANAAKNAQRTPIPIPMNVGLKP